MPEPFTIVSLAGITFGISKLLISVAEEVKYQYKIKNKKVKVFYMVDINNINQECCTICLEKPDKAIQLKCGHVFHKECINQWLPKNKTCPNCRELIINY